jgi:hypothetical protein
VLAIGGVDAVAPFLAAAQALLSHQPPDAVAPVTLALAAQLHLHARSAVGLAALLVNARVLGFVSRVLLLTLAGLLWARAGVPHCPKDGSPVARQSASQITETVLGWPEETRIQILGPMVRGRKGEFKELFEDLRKRGFVRCRRRRV